MQQSRIERILLRCRMLWPQPEVWERAFQTFCAYRLSHQLGLLDAIIAQQSISLGIPLCTFNEKHYRIIPDLETLIPYER